MTIATLDQMDDGFLTYCEAFYLTSGGLPSKEKCKSNGWSDIYINRLYGDTSYSRAYRDNLVTRGVRLGLVESIQKSTNDAGVLTELQFTTAVTVLDLRDNRSTRTKLATLGVSSSLYSAWLKDPVFQQFMRTLSENMLGDNQHEAHYALLGKVRAGDMSAIKYYNELTGRFTPTSPSNSSGLDARALLTRVIEAIQKHVKDPDVQRAIAEELGAYAAANGVTTQLTEPYPLPVPRIAIPTPVEVVATPGLAGGL